MLTDEDKKDIKDQLIPEIDAGNVTLILGAGFSVGTPNKAKSPQGMPSTRGLIEAVFDKALGSVPTELPDLPEAFSLGKDEIAGFDDFLTGLFTCSNTFDWQRSIFKHWWRAIFSTNIDDIPDVVHEVLSKKKLAVTSYRFFNHTDGRPVDQNFLHPPFVKLHGDVRRLDEGVIFDRVSYADMSARNPDWITEIALHVTNGNCLFVGSSFRESDIEAAIRHRELSGVHYETSPSWMVLKDCEEWQKKIYLRRGIRVIRSTAEEFFNFLSGNSATPTAKELVARRAPSIAGLTNLTAAAWMAENFSEVSSQLADAGKEEGITPQFLRGDFPRWYYLAKGVPVEFGWMEKISLKLEDMLRGQRFNPYLQVLTGSVAQGKSTALRQMAMRISKLDIPVYEFIGDDEISIGYVVEVLKAQRGKVVLIVDSAADYFNRINAIADRIAQQNPELSLLILAADRTDTVRRNLHNVTAFGKNIDVYEIDSLSEADALKLANLLIRFGVDHLPVHERDQHALQRKILDVETGYRGDLLATLYSVYSGRPFERKMDEEYAEVEAGDANRAFNILAIITCTGHGVSYSDFAQILRIEPHRLLNLIATSLSNKIFRSRQSRTVSIRHRSIAEYLVRGCVPLNEKRRWVSDILRVLSTKWSVDDIKKGFHPNAWRIYKGIIHHTFLMDIFWNDRDTVHSVYSEAQQWYGNDSLFWLQYGKFLEAIEEYDDSVAALEHSLAQWESSWQIRHALGSVLLRRYSKGLGDDDDFSRGIEFLDELIAERNFQDPYPVTTKVARLLDILETTPGDNSLRAAIASSVREGERYHVNNHGFRQQRDRARILGAI